MVTGSTANLFEVDTIRLREVIGGLDSWRHVIELVANVFAEYRGYNPDRKKPVFCEVSLTKNGRKPAVLTVEDDGAGFDEVTDVWTFFRSTEKRDSATVSGRFNAGEKQLLAMAIEAEILTNNHTVVFKNGERKHTRHRTPVIAGTKITASFRWNFTEFEAAVEQLKSVIPPAGLRFVVNGELIESPKLTATTRVTLPTVLLKDMDGVAALRQTRRATNVQVLETEGTPTLYELGVPICALDHEFPYSLNVEQKIPVPMTRDVVSKSYIERLIGLVLESTAMDGISLLTDDHADATFIKASLGYITNTDALKKVTENVFPNAVQWSSDTQANAMAALEGVTVLTRGKFGRETIDRLKQNNILPSAIEQYGNRVDKMRVGEDKDMVQKVSAKCPSCKHEFVIEVDA